MIKKINTYSTRVKLRICLILICIILPSINLKSQVFINEFSASNYSIIEDDIYRDYSDWLELYNSGPDELNLKGYFLSDNFNIPFKWQIAEDVIIPSGGYLLIWADGMDQPLHTNFKISADGEELLLHSPGLELLDSISFGPQKADISYGRRIDDPAKWSFYNTPTPGFQNSSEFFTAICFHTPVFSIQGGKYSSAQDVALSNDFGGLIRYTTDGSEPDIFSPEYLKSVRINETTLLRARIFKEDQLPGPTVTNSYFINENSAQGKLPLVSIASAPENFWDDEKGIYVQTYKPSWEIPVNIELFENNGSDRAAFNERAGIKVNGLYSWKLPQKMLGVYFRNVYGSSRLDYPLVHQRNRTSFKNFALRASGSDWSYTLFRDILSHDATLLNMDIDMMGFRPSVVYINGAYMGIHNIREKVDDDYIESSYSMPEGSFDLIENTNYVEAGDMDQMDYYLSLLKLDLSVEENYNALESIVDIENFTDYVITEIAAENTSLDHNVMMWKPKGTGKWRWVLMDLDRGFFNPFSKLLSFYITEDKYPLSSLIKNPSYKQYFAKRLSSQLFTSFNSEWINFLIDRHANDIETEMPNHIERWSGTTSSYGNAMPSFDYWKNEICNLKSFARIRPSVVLQDLENYGFSGFSHLTLSTFPAGAGEITLNGLKVPFSVSSGPLLRDIHYSIETENKPGFEFTGWYKNFKNYLIPIESDWQFYDNAVYPGNNWYQPDFNDDSWQNGKGQFGYGEEDENTILDYGGNSSNRTISYYFRKNFNISKSQKDSAIFSLSILADDGAIIYLNGTAFSWLNMDCMDVNHSTLAINNVSGYHENLFFNYLVDSSFLVEGENVIAVEVHQDSPYSSDLSFDLELSFFHPDDSELLTSNSSYDLFFTEDIFLTAAYSETSNCIVPEIIDEDLSLSSDCSPWLVQGDITILENASLNIEAGVEILMAPDANIFVKGAFNVLGTENDQVVIRGNPDQNSSSWGGIVFQHTKMPSRLSCLVIEDASSSPDPLTGNAAISAFHSDLEMDHLTLVDVHGNPIVARYSDIVLTNSDLHSKITGDLINVKYGKARIENCTFTGNDQPDTDAIDYDDIEDGIIRNCKIQNFFGFNSDAVDIGEKSTNVLIDSLFVHNITDKGVSIGQRSSAIIQNSVFINCNMGVALKDSSRATINHCVFYSNVQGVASFEKNPGQAGGNANIINSILSNSSGNSVFTDSKSTCSISYSLSDNKVLPGNASNIHANPRFENPAFYNFMIQDGSPAYLSGSDQGVPASMGIAYKLDFFEPQVMISQFFVNAAKLDYPEFICLFNPSEFRTDVSGYQLTKGVTAILPEGTFLNPREVLFLTENAFSNIWSTCERQVFQWEEGSLSNNGEAIQLENRYGIVIDYINYQYDGLWPLQGFSSEGIFQLSNTGSDNHLPENWASIYLSARESSEKNLLKTFKVFPNPGTGLFHINAPGKENQLVEIFEITGTLIMVQEINVYGNTSIDLQSYNPGVYLIRIGNEIQKVLLIK